MFQRTFSESPWLFLLPPKTRHRPNSHRRLSTFVIVLLTNWLTVYDGPVASKDVFSMVFGTDPSRPFSV